MGDFSYAHHYVNALLKTSIATQTWKTTFPKNGLAALELFTRKYLLRVQRSGLAL